MLDDDDRYLELLRLMLDCEGYEVITSTSAEKFGELMELHRPDAVVIDVLMGEHNGIELAQRYIECTELIRVPIVFMSAWTGAGDLQLPSNSSRIYKPFTQSELVNAIEENLSRMAANRV